MTRSQFLTKLGLGALACAVAPKMMAEKSKKIDLRKEAKRFDGPARITKADVEEQKLYQEIMFGNSYELQIDGERHVLDGIRMMTKQAGLSGYKPDAAFMNINSKVIDILDPKNKKIVERYLKIQ